MTGWPGKFTKKNSERSSYSIHSLGPPEPAGEGDWAMEVDEPRRIRRPATSVIRRTRYLPGNKGATPCRRGAFRARRMISSPQGAQMFRISALRVAATALVAALFTISGCSQSPAEPTPSQATSAVLYEGARILTGD